MAQKFNCPNCGAPNQYDGEGATVVCTYCGKNVRPPDEMVNQAAVTRVGSKAKVWIVLFIVVVFVLPACLGLGGALIGIVASVFSAIIVFIAALFGG